MEASSQNYEAKRSSAAFKKQLLTCRVLFFFFHGASGCFYPFLGVSLKDKGLDPAKARLRYKRCYSPGDSLCLPRSHPSVIGLIFSCAPLIRSVAAVVWTMVADELSLHRSILWFSIVAGSVLHALFAVFPPDVLHLLPLFVTAEFFVSAVVPLSDSALLCALEEVDAVSEYGNYRLWGSFSYGILFSPLTGAVLAVTSGWVHDYGPFACHVLLCLVAALAATQLTFRPTTSSPTTAAAAAAAQSAVQLLQQQQQQDDDHLRRIASALSGGAAAHLLLFFVAGGTGACIDSFLWVDVQSRGGSTLIDGVALMVVAVSEVAVFFYSGRLQRALGVDGSFALVLLCYVVRLTTYAGLHLEKRERWEILPVQVLNGVTFALFWSTANAYCRAIAPEGLEASMLGLMGAATNLGAFALTFSGGQVFQRVGAAPLWCGLAALNLACLLVLMATMTRGSSGHREAKDDAENHHLRAPLLAEDQAPADTDYEELSSGGEEESAVEVYVVSPRAPASCGAVGSLQASCAAARRPA